jgi:ribosome-binding factor A
MESTRQQKISRLIQKDLGEIFQQESRNLFENTLITVTKVMVSKDLAIAKVYLSLFGSKDKEALIGKIRKQGGEIRYFLAKRVHNQLRIMPELHFHLDDSLDYIDNIDHLLKEN